ncbi:MAG TPA: hypothetical protein VGK08_01090 [Thermoanaerobaculia bacterium]
MNRSRQQILLAGLVAFALTAGPVAAACADCCPKGESRPSVIAPPACCGNCAPALEKSPDPVTIAAKKGIVGPQVIGAVSEPSNRIGRTQKFHLVAALFFSLPPSSPASQAPLRL